MGRTGLKVSSLGLGTMTWGRDTEDHDAAEQLEVFLDAGGTLIDTAASYGDGASEALLGRLLGAAAHRRDVVIVSKGGAHGATRGELLDDLDASLERLGTDHLDLWLVARPDRHTPMEETAGALEFALSSGRTRYVGLSNYPAWGAAHLSTLLSALPPGLAAVEMEYSLLQRGIERDLLPAAHELGFGVLAWSPLGRGILTGKYRSTVPASSRAASAHLRGFVEPYLGDASRAVVEAVATAASGLERSAAEVALAWARDAPGISSAIVGARSAAQLRGTLGAVDLELPAPIRAVLDEVTDLEVGYPERF
ncbi:aryl-alcohol dehydrogenase-like predicted oxidoreductase [Bogoriella caseilytica]|uniref:Aryl-alcohol dehydrogenase-like predicted oxidoreductase n=1 Tax=Bogoriella caseilytica TaxID=56055 RepID=A0A3N2B922_9MICO|nr:aryl-alcohol dehydrogenase-like predicted oxidoreductase [Bogoriella caseilytica]